MRRAVFLDRDGVLTRSDVRDGKPYAPRRLEDFELLPGVAETARALQAAGWLLIVVTNQPDLATGQLAPETLDAMHARLRDWLPLDDIRTCRHVDADRCDCRKPKPGLLVAAAQQWGVELQASFMIGDRWRDVSAGKAAGCRTIFLECGYAEALRDAPDFVVKSLSEAGNLILGRASAGERNGGNIL